MDDRLPPVIAYYVEPVNADERLAASARGRTAMAADPRAPERRPGLPVLRSTPPAPVLAALAAGLVVFAAALLRQEGIPKVDTMWAEDGSVYLMCAYEASAIECLAGPYQGYLQLVSRVIAQIASAVPPTALPATIAVSAALVAGLAAAVTAATIADATRSAVAGAFGGAGLGLVWQAGREVLGNLANLHWVLFAASIVSIACLWLGARRVRPTIALATATALTSPFAAIIAAASGAALVARRVPGWRLFAVPTAAAILQVAIQVTAPREVRPGEQLTARQIAEFFRDHVIRDGFFGPESPVIGAAVPVALVLLVVALVVASRRVALATAIVVIGLVAIAVGVCLGSLYLNRAANPRYAYLPTAIVVAGVAVAGGMLARSVDGASRRARWVGRAVPAVIAVVVGLGFATSFRLEARASTGPDVSEQIAAARRDCPAESHARIVIAPTNREWLLPIPCSRLRGP